MENIGVRWMFFRVFIPVIISTLLIACGYIYTESKESMTDEFAQPIQNYKYYILVELSKTRANGKDWDSINIGGSRKPDIKIELDSQLLFVCKNSYYCDGEFVSKNKSFHIKLSELDITNSNEDIGEGDCKSGLKCKIGLALVKIERSEEVNKYGACNKSIVDTLAHQQVMRNIKNIGNVSSYSYMIKNCDFIKKNNHFKIVIETRFVGEYSKFMYSSEGVLIASKEGSVHEYAETRANRLLKDLKIMHSVKRLFLE